MGIKARKEKLSDVKTKRISNIRKCKSSPLIFSLINWIE